VLEEARLQVGATVDLSVQEGVIVIAPARRVRGSRSLEEIVAEIPNG